MTRYQIKPRYVDAYQWTEQLNETARYNAPPIMRHFPTCWHVKNADGSDVKSETQDGWELHGRKIEIGDWIVNTGHHVYATTDYLFKSEYVEVTE